MAAPHSAPPPAAGADAAARWDAHVHVFDSAAPTQPGHYRPAHQPLERIEALAAAHGVGRLVLVQPSVYGTDNTVMLQALAARPGVHRGVAVVDGGIADAELDRMHALGVRGVRFNLVSPVGNGPQDLDALAPRLRGRGWHVQWYAAPEHLERIAAWHAGSGVGCVLDHLAGLHAELPAGDAAWGHLERLADQGAWIKLSGWYRLRAPHPYGLLHAHIERVARRMPQRMVWGSDWPHTSFPEGAQPAYGAVFDPVAAALGAEAAEAARRRAAQLYA
ncbi:amidohydrolase family protein [Acidovorax sp. NCPPB 2350]|nr:amidohydrolase family protein [Acidovorax sp. NCPPB 2350]